MTKHNIPKTIPEAAQLLDKVNPGWQLKITRPINMHWCKDCILGQVYGDFSAGSNELFGETVNRYTPFGHEANVGEWICEINTRMEPAVAHDWTWAVQQMKAGHSIGREAWSWGFALSSKRLVLCDSSGIPSKSDPSICIDWFDLTDYIILKKKLTFADLTPGDKFRLNTNGPTLVCCKFNQYINEDFSIGNIGNSMTVVERV